MTLCSIGELALQLGVSVVTLRRWHRMGKLMSAGRTPGGHRRYGPFQARASLGLSSTDSTSPRKTIAYARVSSHDQKAQLLKQAERLRRHCEDRGWATEVITDLGSGMNYRKPGLRRLLGSLLRGQVERLVLVTKDRLLRFGAELVFGICAAQHVDVVILDEDRQVPREQQLTEDLVEILTVFSSRLYGSRSRKNLRALQAP